MPTVVDALMAPGSLTVPFRRDPDLEELLAYFSHLQLWWGDEYWQGPLLKKDPQRGLIVCTGGLMPWWFGVENEGTPDIVPLIRYCAATNKLSNADFSLGSLYWNPGEDSGWQIVAGEARTVTAFEREDVFPHQDSFEVFPGDPMILGVSAYTLAEVNAYLRARAILSGRFAHPNLVTNPDFSSGTGWTLDDDTEISDGVLKLGPIPHDNLLTNSSFTSGASWDLSADVAITGGELVLGPVVKPNLLVDPTNAANWELGDLPSDTKLDWTGVLFGGVTRKQQFLTNRTFEDGVADWTVESSGNVSTRTDGGAHGTTDYVRFLDGGSNIAYVKQILTGIISGDELNLSGFCRCPEGAIDAGGQPVALVYAFRYVEEDEDFTPTAHTNHTNVMLPGDDVVGTTWRKQSSRFNVPDFDEGTDIDFRVFCPDIIDAGYWDLDHFSLQRTRGNVEAIGQLNQGLGSYFPVVPQKRYSGQVVLISANVRRHGSWSMEVVTRNSDGTNQDVHRVAELTVSEKTDTNTIHRLDFDFTPEEGQDRARIKMYWEDVYVGAIWAKMDRLKVNEATGHRRYARQANVAVDSEGQYRLAITGKVDTGVTEGNVFTRIVYQGVDPCDAVQESSHHDFRRSDGDVCEDAPDHLNLDFTVPKEVTAIDVEIWTEDTEGGAFRIQDAELYRTEGLRRTVTQTASVDLIPERSYEFKGLVKPDEGLTRGKAWLRAVLHNDYQDDVIVDGSPLEFRDDAFFTDVTLNVTPPTGYDSGEIVVVGEDIEGGQFQVDRLSFRDGDKSTSVIELRVTPPAAGIGNLASYTKAFTVPQGAESAGFQVAVDGPDGTDWVVKTSSLRRDCVPVAATTVVREAVSGTGLSEGTYHDAGNIGIDLDWRNFTRQQRLDEVSRAGIVLPPREWDVASDGSVSWGLPEELFTDRTNFILAEGDAVLVDDPDVQRSMELFATKVRLLGAERQSIGGAPYTVTAEATNPAGDLVLFDGSAFSREQLIEDGSVDHAEYAAALARDKADELLTERESYVLGLSDYRTLGKFRRGDWIQVWHPTEGVTDPTNPRSVNGRTIYPKRLRVIDVELTAGSGPFKVKLRKLNGEVVDVSSFVDWPTATSAKITVGSLIPEFLSNPQQAVGPAYMKFRKAVRTA